MSARPRWGVLGGTFDPVHLGHLRAAECAREALDLERVVFVPARTPPHRAAPAASADDRLRMLELALADAPAFEASAIELERGGPSYTIETLDELARRSAAELFFIAGSDAFREIDTWKDWRTLLARYSFVVHGRPGDDGSVAPPAGIDVPVVDAGRPAPHGRPAIHRLEAVLLDVSATRIRELARRGRSIRYLVPRAVEEYIVTRRLYRKGH